MQKELINENIEESGDLIIAVMGEIRRDKAENQKPLNAEIQKLTIYSETKKISDVLHNALEDLRGTLKIDKTKVIESKGEGREVQGYPDVCFVATY
jgi:valyl-tRNA synthetase